MSRTYRSIKHANVYARSIKHKRAKDNQSLYLSELTEAGFNPRPRDKKRLPDNWDDYPVSACKEIYQWWKN